MTPNPDIMAGILRDQFETDKKEKAKGRGRGNAHRLGDKHGRIFKKTTEEITTDLTGNPSLMVCSVCGCPTKGQCPHHGDAGRIDQQTFEALLTVERERERLQVETQPQFASDAMKHDSVRIRSWGSGCSRHQVAAFNRKFGHLGVKYLPNGQAEYRNRAAKLNVFAARGLFDKDEVRSPRNA